MAEHSSALVGWSQSPERTVDATEHSNKRTGWKRRVGRAANVVFVSLLVAALLFSISLIAALLFGAIFLT
jgi:hypothetical protein